MDIVIPHRQFPGLASRQHLLQIVAFSAQGQTFQTLLGEQKLVGFAAKKEVSICFGEMSFPQRKTPEKSALKMKHHLRQAFIFGGLHVNFQWCS